MPRGEEDPGPQLLIITTSKALVTTSKALVSNSFYIYIYIIIKSVLPLYLDDEDLNHTTVIIRYYQRLASCVLACCIVCHSRDAT